jgi:hypothetical protein
VIEKDSVMKTKVCNDCRIEKPHSYFGYDKQNTDNKLGHCKQCAAKRVGVRRKTKDGVILTIFCSQKLHSKARNHQPPTYTGKELRDWILAQPIFHELYDKWVGSGYSRWEKPSCDRIDDYKGYSFDNIRLITFRENNERGHSDRVCGINNKMNRQVLRYDLNGNFIEEYYSTAQAGRGTGLPNTNIVKACRGKIKSCGGFIWKYKE